jgi:hypothetical protein
MMPRDGLGDTDLHFWLTRSVARVMGVNLSEAMADNRLSPDDYSALVTACRGCALVENCTLWLAEHTSTTRLAPAGCVNAGKLEELARAN